MSGDGKADAPKGARVIFGTRPATAGERSLRTYNPRTGHVPTDDFRLSRPNRDKLSGMGLSPDTLAAIEEAGDWYIILKTCEAEGPSIQPRTGRPYQVAELTLASSLADILAYAGLPVTSSRSGPFVRAIGAVLDDAKEPGGADRPRGIARTYFRTR